MAELRRKLMQLLAIDGPNPMPPEMTFLLPQGQGPFPAVLYAHAHGGRYDLGRRELVDGAPWLSAPFAADLTQAGFAVLCIDMPCFGDRQSQGSEINLSRAGEWRGQPLFGQMVADLLGAFEWMAQNPTIQADKITTLGMSMGAALSMWTGALEPRVHTVVQLCMLANIREMIGKTAHAQHGPYLTVPGMLSVCDMGDVAASIAPRPQFIAHGETDHLTPATARDAALKTVRAAYDPIQLTTYLSPQAGHVETPQMRRAVMEFLAQNCK